MNTAFFLAANSASGFFSLYKELIEPESANTIYILKGGPGSGKSTFMRKVSEELEIKGHRSEKVYCSSDPSSLDAVIFPSLSCAVVDGTAPHVIEPEYPLVVERYINLTEAADFRGILEKRKEIINTKKKYSAFFPHVYRYTAAAGYIDAELSDIAQEGISKEKLLKKADGIIYREIRGNGHSGKIRHRFLSAISPEGYISLTKDKNSPFEHTYVIEDSFGLASTLLAPIADAAAKSGYDCTVCLNALKPDRIEHLFVPELSLAFISSDKLHPYTGNYYRKIRLDTLLDLKNSKQKLSLLSKLKNSLMNDACATLAEAKLLHDELEDLYNPYINFNNVFQLAKAVASELSE